MMGARARRIAVLGALLFAVLMTPAAGFAADSPNNPSSTQLIEQPKSWNGKTVTFRGEAIAERMVRGDYAWIHLNDDGYYLKNVEEGSGLHGYNSGMPVWIPAKLTDQIATYGDYKHEGEVVEVRGVFNAACAIHGGDMDIHATELTRVLPGRHAIDAVKTWKLPVAFALILLAAVLWWADRASTATLERGLVTRKRA